MLHELVIIGTYSKRVEVIADNEVDALAKADAGEFDFAGDLELIAVDDVLYEGEASHD